MTAQRPLIEKVLDIVVYAPVGLALQIRSDLDTFATSGRTQVSERVQVARWIGEMAVTYGRREIEKRLAGVSVETKAAATPASQPVGQTVVRLDPEPSAAVERQTLLQPFDGYQSLAAAQVVQLLGRLPADQLAVIRAYEAAHRGRRTILAKLDQLLVAP